MRLPAKLAIAGGVAAAAAFALVALTPDTPSPPPAPPIPATVEGRALFAHIRPSHWHVIGDRNEQLVETCNGDRDRWDIRRELQDLTLRAEIARLGFEIVRCEDEDSGVLPPWH